MSVMRPGVVFDLDETLIDRRASLDVYARFLRSSFETNTQHDEERFVAAFHELDDHGRVPRQAFFTRLSEAAFDNLSPEKIAVHFREFAWLKPLLFTNVVNVINIFRSNDYAIGVVSNGGSHSQNAKIANSGLSSYLDAYVISEEFGQKKPHPNIYAEIVQRLQIDPKHSWFVGDDPVSDVIGPSQYGFNTAWLNRYLAWPEGQKRCYTHRLSHISQLADALIGST